MESSVAPVSRRTLFGTAFGVGAAAVLAGCSDDDDERAASITGGSAPVTAATVAPQLTAVDDEPISAAAVVALDEIAALAVLSLGITPTTVDATFGYTSVTDICDSLGITVNPGGRSVEAVIADAPSAVVGVSIPTFVEAVGQYERVVPAIVVDFASSWQQQLNQIGSALGVEAAATALTGQLDESVRRLRDDLASAARSGTTVSVIAATADGPFALSRTGLVGQLLRDVGLSRPAAQDVDTAATTPFIDISDEQLEAHDAEVVIRLTGAAYPTDTLESSPLWPQLGAVEAGAVSDVFAELWFAASGFALSWVIADLRAILLDDGSVGTGDDAVTRWATFAPAG